jgi:ribose transport system ATP-binding protein
MKILQGVYQRDSGDVRVLGELVSLPDTFAARAAGIGMVFQEFSLVPTLTVWQNIFLTAEPMTKFGLIDDASAKVKAQAIFEDMGVSVDASAILENLPAAHRNRKSPSSERSCFDHGRTNRIARKARN